MDSNDDDEMIKSIKIESINLNDEVKIDIDKNDYVIRENINNKNNKNDERKMVDADDYILREHKKPKKKEYKPKEKENKHNNNNWNESIKIRLKAIGEKSMSYRWLHYQESLYYENCDKKINLIIGILVSVLGILSGSSIITNNEDEKIMKLIMNIVELCFTVTLGILFVLKEQGDYKNKNINHQQLSYKFMNIYHDIIEQLSFLPEDRENGTTYLIKISKSYNNLMEVPLNIRQSVIDEFLKTTANNGLQKPVITGTFDTIKINRDADLDSSNGSEIENNNLKATMDFEVNRWLKHL